MAELSKTRAGNIRNRIVLIVDDSVAIRKQVRAILEREGCQVREAGSEIGMLNAMEEYGQKVQLVLMDLNLNQSNGFDLIGRLREIEQYRDVPVVILTEHADREKVAIARMAGVKSYLVKPIDAALLVERIAQVLETA